MNYHEKRTIVVSLVGLSVSLTYLFYAIFKIREGSAESLLMKFWAERILLFIGIGIVSVIVAMIVFHILYSISLAIKLKMENEGITNEAIQQRIEQTIKTDTVEDEMGKLIELKAMRIGFVTAGVGFVGSLVSLLLGATPVIMINILYLSFSLGSILEGIVQIFYYRRGIRHG